MPCNPPPHGIRPWEYHCVSMWRHGNYRICALKWWFHLTLEAQRGRAATQREGGLATQRDGGLQLRERKGWQLTQREGGLVTLREGGLVTLREGGLSTLREEGMATTYPALIKPGIKIPQTSRRNCHYAYSVGNTVNAPSQTVYLLQKGTLLMKYLVP